MILLAPLWAEMMEKYTGIRLEPSPRQSEVDAEGRVAWATADAQVQEMTRRLLAKRAEWGYLWSDGDGRCLDAWCMATNQADIR